MRLMRLIRKSQMRFLSERGRQSCYTSRSISRRNWSWASVISISDTDESETKNSRRTKTGGQYSPRLAMRPSVILVTLTYMNLSEREKGSIRLEKIRRVRSYSYRRPMAYTPTDAAVR